MRKPLEKLLNNKVKLLDMKKINQLLFKISKAVLMLVFIVLFSLTTTAQAFIDATEDAVSLPVSYIRFTGNEINNTVVLNWTTAREINNSHFNIQHSSNGMEFENISKVNGKGNSSAINEYTFSDATIQNGNLYYRLQQVDFDGKSSYSSIVVIKKSKDKSVEISIYPNPLSITSKAFLAIKGIPEGNYNYLVRSVTGQTICTNTFNHVGSSTTVQIQTPNHIKAGIYTLLVQNAKGEKIDCKQIIIR
jgi:hypothetical protein